MVEESTAASHGLVRETESLFEVVDRFTLTRRTNFPVAEIPRPLNVRSFTKR